MPTAPDASLQPRHERCFRCESRNAQHVLVLAATGRIGELRRYLCSRCYQPIHEYLMSSPRAEKQRAAMADHRARREQDRTALAGLRARSTPA